MIFCVPTPLATPAQRLSTRRMMLQRSAQAWLIIVIWAPETQNKNRCFLNIVINCVILKPLKEKVPFFLILLFKASCNWYTKTKFMSQIMFWNRK